MRESPSRISFLNPTNLLQIIAKSAAFAYAQRGLPTTSFLAQAFKMNPSSSLTTAA
jgi:hypothetical protein